MSSSYYLARQVMNEVPSEEYSLYRNGNSIWVCCDSQGKHVPLRGKALWHFVATRCWKIRRKDLPSLRNLALMLDDSHVFKAAALERIEELIIP